MIRSADWRICIAVGLAAGLAASPFLGLDGGWWRAVAVLGPIALLVTERGKLGWAGLGTLLVAAAIAGSLIGTARLEARGSGEDRGASGRAGTTAAEPGGIRGTIEAMRERAHEALGRQVPEREASLSRGFVLGEDDGIDDRTVDDFRASGLAHLLAVSGQNIVLLSLLAMPLLSLLGLGPRARLLAVAAMIVVYVPLAGGGPSIQRAGVMGIVGLIAAGATSGHSRLYALAVAAAVTLAIDPEATADIGWQLSFAAVIGIMLLARPFRDRLGPLIGNGGWRGALSEGAAVTLAATIATAPLTVLHFETFPIATLPANLAAMPAVAPAMWMGMAAIAVAQVDPVLAVPFNLAGSVFIAWIAEVAKWFGRPAGAAVEVRPTAVELGAATALLAAVLVALLRLWPAGGAPKRSHRLVAAALALVGVLLLVDSLGGDRRHLDPPPPGGARVEILDVGQGDAILVRPDGADPLLIDGGPPGGDLLDALDSAGVDRLEAVMLTHPDLDHYGGLMELFGNVPVGRLLFDRAPPELLTLVRRSGTPLGRVSEGDVVRDGNVRLDLLWPPADDGSAAMPAGTDAETNARSIVALLGWRGFRMLLTGDAEAETVPMDPGPLDVLKVSHHGSEDTGLPGLLDRTSPALAVIPVGEDNRYGHPVPEVLSALGGEGIETLRTDRDGTVSIVLGDDRWRVEAGE